MSGRLCSLLYAAALVAALGSGCAVPRGTPTTVPAPPATTTSRATTYPASSAVTWSSAAAATLQAPSSSAAAGTASTTKPATTKPATTKPATTAVSGTCRLPATLLGKDVTRVPGTAKVVALTFDAGASAGGVPAILARLADRKAPGTFFLTGDFVAAFPAQARTIAATYPIGNHTQTHTDLTTLSAAGVQAEVRNGAASIRRVTGVDPHPYFRFPYGAASTSLIGALNAECYVPFRWTVDSWGWKGTAGGMSAAEVERRVLAAVQPGAIVLMHVGANPDDGTTFDADALPRVVDRIRALGYTLVTLEQVLPDTP